MSQFARQHFHFIIILLGGVFLRILFIKEQGLFNDELSAWFRTDALNWTDFWENSVKTRDMHPGLYQFILWKWVSFFGDSEWVIRSLSLLFFVFNSILIYKLSLKHFSKSNALVFIAIFAGLGYFILNTTFSRPYNSGLFFSLLTLNSLLNTIENENRSLKNGILLTLGFIGAMLSHYFAFLTVGLMGFIALFFSSKSRRVEIIAAGLTACILFLPHLPVTIHQLNQGGLGWLPAPELNWLFKFLFDFSNNSIWILFLLISLVLYLQFQTGQQFSKKRKFTLWSFAIIYLFAHLISLIYTPVLHNLVMIFLQPLLLLGLFGKMEWTFKKNNLSILVYSVLALHSIFIYGINKPVHFAEFRRVGKFINENVDYNKTEFASNYMNPAYINYYLNDPVKEEIVNWSDGNVVYDLNGRAKKSDKPYFVYSYSNAPHQVMFEEVIRSHYPVLDKKADYFHSGARIFRKGDRKLTAKFRKSVNIGTASEFFFNQSFTVGDIRKVCSDSSYLLFTVSGKHHGKSPLYFVATITRNGEMLKENDQPIFYMAMDQTRLFTGDSTGNYFLALNLPEKAKDSDELAIYFWNPDKMKVELFKYEWYVVDENN